MRKVYGLNMSHTNKNDTSTPDELPKPSPKKIDTEKLRRLAKSIRENDTKDELPTRIGMLRQWLNEDRIKNADRFVTNEDIEHWIMRGIESYCTNQIIKELESLKSQFVPTGWAGTHQLYQTSFDIDKRIAALREGK